VTSHSQLQIAFEIARRLSPAAIARAAIPKHSTPGTGVEPIRESSVLVASGDRDTFQLPSPLTTILYPMRAGELARIGPGD